LNQAKNLQRKVSQALRTDVLSMGDERRVHLVSTGSLTLDKMLGGGLAYGTIVEMYGRPMTCKSSIALSTVGNVQRDGRVAVWVDAEKRFDPAWGRKMGAVPEDLVLVRPKIGEQAGDIMIEMMTHNPGVIVLDSTPALVPAVLLDKDLAERTVAPRAALMNRLVSILNALNEDTLLIFINQLISSISPYGPKEVRPGGKRIQYLASVWLKFHKTDWIEKDGVKIGHRVLCNIEKNSLYTPRGIAEFSFLWESGVDREEEIIHLGVLEGIIKKKGSWMEHKNIKGQGRKFIERMKDEGLLEEVAGKL
jgi:recombination protein RecA